MTTFFSLRLIGWCSLLVAGLGTGCDEKPGAQSLRFRVPEHFPALVYDTINNRVTPDGFALGKMLFYDGLLSRDGTISCGSCHQQGYAFTHHGHALSHGIDDQLGSRNAPPIQNMAWTSSFFWDGGVFDLDLFSISPIENPVEMDEDMVRVLEKLKAHPKYPGLFKAAYGTDEINSARVLQALSQFMIMLISDQSRYDQYVTGDEKVLTAAEQAGLAVFEAKCATCHSGVLQTDQTFRNNGLPLRPAPDEGRYRITLNPADKYRFKVPSLRNVAVSAPYMHDGRFRTLDAVLDHYRDGVARTENLDPVLAQGAKPGIALTEEEKTLLISFLHTLTDTAFLFDDRFSEY